MPRSSETAVDAAVGLASWYTSGRTDALGDRLLMFDNTDAVSLELLRFRRELAIAPGFEEHLRRRLQQLRGVRHPAFPDVRAVVHLDNGQGLTLVSTHTPGKRLSEVLDDPRIRVGLHPAFVTWVLQQALPALVALQRSGSDVAHGAVTADRIVLTPEGRLCIVEHVLGGALQSLEFVPTHLWREVGVIAPAGVTGEARLDARSDVIQLAVVALSLLLARRVTLPDVQHRLPLLLEEFSASATAQSSFLVVPLRLWLERALQLNAQAYASAAEAEKDLRDVPAQAGSCALEYLRAAWTSPPPALPSGATAFRPAAPETPLPAGLPGRAPASYKAPRPLAPAAAASQRRVVDFPIAPPFERADAVTQSPPRGAGRTRPRSTSTWIVMTLAVVVAAEAGVIAWLWSRNRVMSARAATSVLTAGVTIDSPQPGDTVLVNGKDAGVTPFRLSSDTQVHSIVVVSTRGGKARPAPRASSAAPRTGTAGATTPSPAPGAVRSGIRVASPIELQALDGDKVLGSTASGPIMAAPGTHALDFINVALGYRTRQTVTISPGEIAALTITPPMGRLSIDAQPGAQVLLDQSPVGETPLADVVVALGDHEVIFRHPDFGERRERVTVRADGVTRVSVTFSGP